MTDTPEIPPAVPDWGAVQTFNGHALIELGFGPCQHVVTREFHRVAALCLYGQPFGFTHEELRALREGFGSDCPKWDDFDLADSAFAKIAALLPPASR